jgi:hypothetical protein
MRQSESTALPDPGRWSSLAVPDLIYPEQYAGLLRPFSRSPETELLVAVIADAVAVYVRHFRDPHPKRRVEFEEVQRWFASEDTSEPFGFLNVCSALDLEPTAVQVALTLIRDAQIHAGSAGSWRAVRRGGGRRHSVGPSPAGAAVGSRPPQRAQLRGDGARRSANGSSSQAPHVGGEATR